MNDNIDRDKVYTYIDAELAKALNSLGDTKAIGTAILEYFKKEKSFLFSHIEELDFDTATLQRQLKDAKSKLEEAIQDEVRALDNLWDTSVAKIRSFRELLSPIREDVKIITRELKEVTTLIYAVDVDRLERIVSLVKELRDLTDEDKRLLEFLSK